MFSKKSITAFLLFSLCVLHSSLFAQTPEKMTYQSVIRDAAGNLITNSTIGVRVSIYEGTPPGVVPVFQEVFSASTNANGLVSLEIGSTTPLSSIAWETGQYFIQIDTDPLGGSNYTISGTSNLLTVPYAFYANKAKNVDYADVLNAPTAVSAFTNDAGYITSPNDADSNPTNEIQTLSLSGSTLSISGGNSVVLTAGTGNTLDMSYDQGGSGAGRQITADAGAVEITSSVASQASFNAIHTGNGVAILASNSSPSSTFSTVQASTASTSNSVSAVIGNSTGAAWGVSGQVMNTATAEAAVYGNNLRTNGGYGVKGVGYNGLWGLSSQLSGAGVWGENTNVNGTGLTGLGNGQAPQVLAAGSGGAFMGWTTGIFSKFNTTGIGQGMTIQDNYGAQWTVGVWDGSAYRKIAGTGTVNTIIPDMTGQPVLMTAPEAPEVLFEDYGQGQLINGMAQIFLDPIFTKNILVNDEHPLRVFITLEGDCKGVFVTNKTANGFVVKELSGGSSNVPFTYQVVANRADEVMPSGRVVEYSKERFQSAGPLQEVIQIKR